MNIRAPLLMAAALFAPVLLQAEPADYLNTPIVEPGEKEIDFKAGTATKDSDPRATAFSTGFGYGANDWWFTELYVKYKNESTGAKFDAVEWENSFQLTETGKYPVDAGFLLEVERPHDRAEGWEVKWGPLLQTEFGKLQLNGNLLFQRNYRADFANSTQLKYQWQMKYRWQEAFEFGLQGFGELGKWDNWAPGGERIHTVGPAVFGKIPLGSHQAIKYNAAWLLASSGAAQDHTVRMQVEYEF
jgi:hypothetical protein